MVSSEAPTKFRVYYLSSSHLAGKIMRHLIEFTAKDGSSLLVEVDEIEGAGPRPAGVGDGLVERASMGIDQALAKVRPMAESLLSELQSLTHMPETVAVEFGIKLNASAGVVIANTAVEGNCKITLTWKQRD
jgi:Trypsin-co-occurring domain 1